MEIRSIIFNLLPATSESCSLQLQRDKAGG
ncbi:hypothetical protein F383_31969 [Gossypium arboreum]|uniref:Uncharacterized protein n=1 Tax=Gossypium arboreum TaxID=29729 RepID=A0A0B0N3U1_GOSAR|nr:hypothetical protein F383_31969 [Gossypium arboreum]